MRFTHIIYILIATALLTACSKEDLLSDKAGGDIIQLSANVEGVTEVTRAGVEANPYRLETPTTESPLSAMIWLTTTSCSYSGNTYGAAGANDTGSEIDAHRTITYVNANPTTPSGYNGEYLRYPAVNTKEVYCIGMYPAPGLRSVWSGNTTSVSASINGKDDLMFAPEIKGTGADPLSKRQQTFHHLLTWIKVRVRADELITGDTWGALKKISIISKNRLTIPDLTQATATYDGTATEFTMFEDSYELNTTSIEKGSVFVAPVEADGTNGAEYTLHIECEHVTKDIPVNLVDTDGNNFSGMTTGKVFVITLRFSSLAYIEGTVTLEPWEDEYRDLVLQ